MQRQFGGVMRISTAIRRAQKMVDDLVECRDQCDRGSIGWNDTTRDINALVELANFASRSTWGSFGPKVKAWRPGERP